MAEPETAYRTDAQAEKPNGPRKQNQPPGWAHNRRGFVINVDGRTIHPFCQETMQVNEEGEPIACGKKPRYVRTLWSGGTVFSCGRHLDRMERFARPVVGMGSRGAVVMKPVMLDAPHYRQVPGAVEPAEHPVHIALPHEPEEPAACWCGAEPRENEWGHTKWEGGRPTDKPWWERKQAPRNTPGNSSGE